MVRKKIEPAEEIITKAKKTVAKSKATNNTLRLHTRSKMLELLRKPIEQKWLSDKTMGGRNIQYVNVTDCKDIFDSRIGSHRWSAEILNTIDTTSGIVTNVRVHLYCKDEDFFSDGTGLAKHNVSYGDSASNSYAKALRRAMEGFGFCRELWREELSEEQKETLAIEEQVTAMTDAFNALNAILSKDEKRKEKDVAEYYSKGRVQKLEELTYVEAGKAIPQLNQLLVKQKAKVVETSSTSEYLDDKRWDRLLGRFEAKFGNRETSELIKYMRKHKITPPKDFKKLPVADGQKLFTLLGKEKDVVS